MKWKFSGTISRVKISHGKIDRILKAQYTLHVGQNGGIITKLIYSLVGIAP